MTRHQIFIGTFPDLTKLEGRGEGWLKKSNPVFCFFQKTVFFSSTLSVCTTGLVWSESFHWGRKGEMLTQSWKSLTRIPVCGGLTDWLTDRAGTLRHCYRTAQQWWPVVKLRDLCWPCWPCWLCSVCHNTIWGASCWWWWDHCVAVNYISAASP